jgi:Domain of unknown function (DUF4157)
MPGQMKATMTPRASSGSLRNVMLQRKCPCGGKSGRSGECEACRKKRLERQTGNQQTAIENESLVPPIVHEVLRAAGQPLDPTTRAFMEPRFSHDFSHIRVHTDATAAESARSLNALAYTVGRDVVFARECYAPEAPAGRELLAHELAHTIQQGANSNAMQTQLTIDDPESMAEKEADDTAERVIAGAPAKKNLTSNQDAIQRQTPGGDTGKKLPEKKDAGEVVVEGLKTVAEQAADDNPQVKKVIIDPIKDRLKGQWGRLGTGEKAATIGLGAGTLGMAGGAMLSDPGGRKQLEGVNLAAPLTLIPYMPLSSFKYTLPSGESPGQRLFKFETGFKADDLINLRTEARGLPKMSLGVNMQWGYDPATDRLSLLGGDASLGLVPGLSLSAGAYKDVARSPQTFMGPEGQMTQVKKSVPEFDKPQPIPDVRIMLNVDLMKFKPSDLARQVKSIF